MSARSRATDAERRCDAEPLYVPLDEAWSHVIWPEAVPCEDSDADRLRLGCDRDRAHAGDHGAVLVTTDEAGRSWVVTIDWRPA